MNNPNQDLRDILNDLSPEERRMLAKATPFDWAKAGFELIIDPSFWGKMITAFLRGMMRGMSR